MQRILYNTYARHWFGDKCKMQLYRSTPHDNVLCVCCCLRHVACIFLGEWSLTKSAKQATNGPNKRHAKNGPNKQKTRNKQTKTVQTSKKRSKQKTRKKSEP